MPPTPTLRAGLAWLLGAVLLHGCSSDGAAGPLDAGFEAPMAECPAESDEDCQACYENVGDCCKPGDLSWKKALPALVGACNANPLCAACCDECAAMTCDELLANDLCPARDE